MNNKKIINKKDFTIIREELRRKSKKIVLCHGVYDLLHYGHIEHLKEARTQGDLLIVSVTAAKYVNKGPGRPYFDDMQRMEFLASLECVDYVILSEAVTVHDIVKVVQPNIYVKGQEYEDPQKDITGNIESEQKIVEEYGGKVYFTQGNVYSSTKLLNKFFDVLPKGVAEVSQTLKRKYGSDLADKLRCAIDSFTDIKVLVVGDIIFDEYIFCSVQGVTSKDAVLSTRYDHTECYAGGALAVARHIADFSKNVTLCSIYGNEDGVLSYIQKNLSNVHLDLIKEHKFITPIKRRYIKQNPLRKEYDKLFSVNILLNEDQEKEVNYTAFHRKLSSVLPDYDLVVICDYGHGAIQKETIKLLEEKAKYLAVNCQTNSSNYGMNIITKYNCANMFVVDERELKLAVPYQAVNTKNKALGTLKNELQAKDAWVTIGAAGAIGCSEDDETLIPAVTLHVKDTVGAGDAFYALVSLCSKINMPIDLATLIGNTAGAIKTNLLGNSDSVKKVDLMKFLYTILNV